MQNHVEQNQLNQNQLKADIWQQMLRASVDKHHEWRSPVLVTNGLVTNGLITDNNQLLKNNFPEARTVILRKVAIDTKTLTFYTDSRSPKVAQIAANPNCTLVFWSKRLSQQLRVKVKISVDTDSELNKKTWQVVKQSPSAGDYLSLLAPGKPLPGASASKENTNQLTSPYFALLIANVVEIDWLALNRDGHQRAKIDASGITYLTP